MKFLLRVPVVLSLIGLSLCASQPKCPQFDACAGTCAIGVDEHGCQTCDCGNPSVGMALLWKKLKESCSTVAECANAFSQCKDKKCQCLDGFKEKDGLCTPPTLQCPTWDGHNDKKAGKACTITVNWSIQDPENNNTCVFGKEFCYAHPNVKDTEGLLVGHCCPKPPKDPKKLNLLCPYDITDKGTCPDTSQIPADAAAPPGLIRTCSYITHDCIQRFGQRSCCPIPCHGASSHFAIEGKCYDYAQIDDLCDFNAQCSGGSICFHQGAGHPICKCKGKTFSDPSPHCEYDLRVG